MKYSIVEPKDVLKTISLGKSVIVCDITDNEIKNTNDMTVSDIRNLTAKQNVVFLVVADE